MSQVGVQVEERKQVQKSSGRGIGYSGKGKLLSADRGGRRNRGRWGREE